MILDTGTVAPAGASASALFSASRRLEIAEHFRIPYLTTGEGPGRWTEHLRAGSGAMLLWPGAAGQTQPPVAAWVGSPPEADSLGNSPAAIFPSGRGAEIRIFGRVLPDSMAEQLLRDHGGEWSPVRAIRGASGERLGSIWRERAGSVLLPFDPDEICENYWSERYLELVGNGRSRARRGLMHSYYRVRGLLPRATQIWLRRNYSHIQARTPFPSWPAETALHDFFDLFLAVIASVAGGTVPRLAAWPDDRTWALVLTHDVETAAGLAAMQPVLDLERSLGVRSCWNLVPHRYEVDDELVRELIADGFEVGVHGLRHDGRDLRSLAELGRRLPAMRKAAERWNAVGFRAPSMHRNWDWMPLLGFEYDSSYPDTDPFEPQAGGCCTWLPFFNRGVVELPMTMPQDHTLFVILGRDDESAWIEKAEFLRDRGGMAMIVTHPDYLVKPRIMDSYRRLLEHFADDGTAWNALPGEVNTWWRRRAASTIERTQDSWLVTGPAARDARIEFVG